MSQATRRYIHVILRLALKRAVEQQVLARNPAEVFKKFKVERNKKMLTLTVQQSARLLEAWSTAAFIGQCYSPLRPECAEAKSLRYAGKMSISTEGPSGSWKA